MSDPSIFLNYGMAGVILFFTYIVFVRLTEILGAKIDQLGKTINELNNNISQLRIIIERNGNRCYNNGANRERKANGN